MPLYGCKAAVMRSRLPAVPGPATGETDGHADRAAHEDSAGQGYGASRARRGDASGPEAEGTRRSGPRPGGRAGYCAAQASPQPWMPKQAVPRAGGAPFR